jgi:hypothetical protein
MRRTNQLYPLDWNLVNTELGGMIEPANLLGPNPNAVQTVDIEDVSSNDIMEINEDQMQDLFNHAGRQLPYSFNS